MSYSEVLSKMIKESGLTLKEIAEQVKVDPSYLSKLQSGKQSPASDEVNTAIAKACKANPDLLIFEGYLDKAPDVVKRYISKSTDSIKDMLLRFVCNVRDDNDVYHFKKRLDNMSPLDFINAMLSDTSSFFKVDDGLSIEVSRSDSNDYSPIGNPLFGIPVFDNSMEPLIKKNALVNLDQIYSDVKEGDIAVINTPLEKGLIRQVFFIDDKVVLIPQNNEYPKEVYDKSEIEFVGRVGSSVQWL